MNSTARGPISRTSSFRSSTSGACRGGTREAALSLGGHESGRQWRPRQRRAVSRGAPATRFEISPDSMARVMREACMPEVVPVLTFSL